jgi:DNA mismatch repair ATPase MutS
MDRSASARRGVRRVKANCAHSADKSALQARVDAIDEIMNTNTYYMEKLRSLLVNMPDLVRGLTRIQYGKVSFHNQLCVSPAHRRPPHPRSPASWYR